MIDLSIIIPVYNALPLLERTLDSIFSQHTKYSFEVVMVDDGSTDNSVQYIQNRREKNIILLQQLNAGPAAARNLGVVNAHGRYCAYLDADDYWNDGFIEKTVSFLDNHPECVAVSVGQKHITVSGGGVKPKCIDNYDHPIVLDDFWGFWSEYMHICTGSATIRTDTLRQSGGQRTELRVTEDLEFWALLSTYGKWGMIPELLFVSDGTSLIIEKAKWIKKMSVRWSNAPTIEEWEKRIACRIPKDDEAIVNAYYKVRSSISEMLTRCQMLSGRYSLSRREALNNADGYSGGIVKRMMLVCRHSRLLWFCLCRFLLYREYLRFK